MLESLLAALQIPELKARIYFVLAMFAVFVLGVHIPVPGVNHAAVEQFFAGKGGLLGLVDVFSGGALSRFPLLIARTMRKSPGWIPLQWLNG